jgi:uncharacterized protein (DUF608 family)
MTNPHFVRQFSIAAFAMLLLAAGCCTQRGGTGSEVSSTFVAPSPEMVDVSHGPGVPFGGIGTGFSVFGKYGFVDVYFDGRHLNGNDWRIDVAPEERPTFAFELSEVDKKFVLQETRVDWLAGAQPMDKVRAYADLPKGHFVCEKADANLGLEITAFSPMVPHDLMNSTIPAQIYDVTVQNRGNKTRLFELALLDRDPLIVRDNKAVLIEDKGETAFACDGGAAANSGVSKSFRLGPGKTQNIRFYIAWYYPAVKTTSSAARETYQRYYTRQFHNAEQIIDLAIKSADKWSAAIDRWHADYDVPPAFKRLWFSALCSVCTSTILTDDPYFFEQEVPHGWVNTMDVSVYHNWLYLINWPEIERMDMNQYYQSIAMSGKNAGLVWHSLWDDSSDYAEEPTFIGRVYRDSLWFNDPAWTAKGFKLASLAANHVYRADNYCYLLHNPIGNQSYDIWKMPGVNAYVNVMWVYGLYSLDQMSQSLKQPDTVDLLPVDEMFSKARRSLDELLWNPGGYWNTFFVPTNRPEDVGELARMDGQDTFSDQLFGKWLSLIDPRAESVLPLDKVNAALMTIYTNNLVDDPGKKFRGWANGMRPGHRPELNAGYHSRTCWFGPQEALASLLADSGEEGRSLDVFNSLESSLHDNHLFLGEWNKSVGPDGLSRTLPEEPNKDTPRFPPYPRYKSSWEYLRAILGFKMDEQNFYLNPFRTIGFSLHDVELAGTSFTVTVEPGWTKVFVDGQLQTGSAQCPRSAHKVKIVFIK